MRKINKIVIHCADTPGGVYFDSKDIKKWHVQERGWSDIGYHYIVLLDGTIEKGREDETPGAHVSGHNNSSIGVCYIGGKGGIDTRTEAQKQSLNYLVGYLKRLYMDSIVLGHRDFTGVTKHCPSFDAQSEYIFT